MFICLKCVFFIFQRWGPVRGFSDKSLIFSDRPPWSDDKGLRVFPRPGDVRLPNKHWKWESDWHVDENFKGQPTGKGVGVMQFYTGCIILYGTTNSLTKLFTQTSYIALPHIYTCTVVQLDHLEKNVVVCWSCCGSVDKTTDSQP